MALSKLKLISHKLCPYVQRARIVMHEKAAPHDIVFIDLGNKPRWFHDVSPLGKVPVLLVDGEPIFESAVIGEYLNEVTPGSLHPEDPFDKAQNRAWIEVASNTLAAIGGFYNAKDARSFDDQTELLVQRFESLEKALGKGPYFNGECFSLVDAAYGPVFRYFDVIERFVDVGFFAGTPKVKIWRKFLYRRPSVRMAVVDDYAERLERFFIDRGSFLAGFVRQGISD